jgi:hypothetical protein
VKLYRYLSDIDDLSGAMRTNAIAFSNPERFPEASDRHYDYDCGGETRTLYRENPFSIACFSRAPDIYPMWTRYANDHTGYCAEYTFPLKRLPDEETVTINSGASAYMRNVRYADERFTYDGDDWMNNFDILRMYCQKSPELEYEREVRLFIGSASPRRVVFNTVAVTAIFFGEKTSLNDISTINRLAKSMRKDISLHRLAWNSATNCFSELAIDPC